MTSVIYTTYIARTPAGLTVSSRHTGELDMCDGPNVLATLLGRLVADYLDRITSDPDYAIAEYRRHGGTDSDGIAAALLRGIAARRAASDQP